VSQLSLTPSLHHQKSLLFAICVLDTVPVQVQVCGFCSPTYLIKCEALSQRTVPLLAVISLKSPSVVP